VKPWMEPADVWIARVASTDDVAVASAWMEEQPFNLDDLDDLDKLFAICEERSPFPDLFGVLRDLVMAEAVNLLR